MNDSAALLPSGLRDTLPPEAEQESAVTERLLAAFRQNGYRQVSPPMVEFEEGLLRGASAARFSCRRRRIVPSRSRSSIARLNRT